MEQAVIIGYKRTPFHLANKGFLTKMRGDDMVAAIIKNLLENIKIKANEIEDLILGCAFPEGEQGLNLARIICFNANLPQTVGGVTVNRFCGSSMQAIHMAVGAIASKAGELFICAGVETMSRVPMGGFNPLPNPTLYDNQPDVYIAMGETAENIANKYKISRQKQDEFAYYSQMKASSAQKNNAFSAEIVALTCNDEIIDKDGCIRADTDLDQLSALKPAFDVSGSVTAGNSSPLTDGAVATVICAENYAKRNNLKILAYIDSCAVAGCAPELMGLGPVYATQKVLKRSNLNLKDIDIIELNEAFASQSLACIEELDLDVNKVNIDGGAIAIGHPLGASGARLLGKLALLLEREQKTFGLATQCIAGGQGIATIIKRI